MGAVSGDAFELHHGRPPSIAPVFALGGFVTLEQAAVEDVGLLGWRPLKRRMCQIVSGDYASIAHCAHPALGAASEPERMSLPARAARAPSALQKRAQSLLLGQVS